MTAFRLGLAELRRLTSSRLALAALVAMVTIPTIYAGLYLYANRDPYGSLSAVPAAVVVEDSGTTLADGSRLVAGTQVGHDLVASRSFAWHEVTRAQARDGVDAGTYDFAIIVPSSFSADLASSAQFTPRQAQLELVTNDANNYLARAIASSVVAQVTKSVAAKVSSSSAQQLLLGFATVHDNVAKAADGAAKLQSGLESATSGADRLVTGADALVTGERQLVDGTATLVTGADRAATGASQLGAGATSLASGLSQLDTRTADLPAQTAALASGAQQVSAGNAAVAGAAARVATASQDAVDALGADRAALDARLVAAGLTDAQVSAVHRELDTIAAPVSRANATVAQTSSQLTTLAAGSARVTAGAQTLATAAVPLRAGIVQASTGVGALRDGAAALASGTAALRTGAQQLQSGQASARGGATQLASGATTLRDGLGSLSTGAKDLHDGLASGLKQIPDPSPAARQAVAQTLGNPIAVSTSSQASAENYGAGLAPFFLSLALWIGGYTLFLIVRPVSSRAVSAHLPSWRVALGGWVAPAVAGTAQALLAYAVVAGGLRIHVAHPLGTIALMVLVSWAFVAILHALSTTLGAVGKFLGLVLMVLQLVSAGGTFPWQTLPAPLQALHHVMPMSYAIDALRRLLYGANLSALWRDVAVLIAYLAGALVASTWAARRARVWTPARLKPDLSL